MFLLLGVRFMLEKAMPLIIITLRYANNIAPEPEIKLALIDHKSKLVRAVTMSSLKKKPGRGGSPIILIIISTPIIDDALVLRVLTEWLLRLTSPLKNIIGRETMLYISNKVFHL